MRKKLQPIFMFKCSNIFENGSKIRAFRNLIPCLCSRMWFTTVKNFVMLKQPKIYFFFENLFLVTVQIHVQENTLQENELLGCNRE